MESVGDFEYNTKDLIGHGAFAVVFKGRHKTNRDLVVAIKSITKKNLAKSQNLLGKEIKILKELTELHHENVVALLDCKETPHHVYLVMEYCNGGDLADYLHAKGTLSEDTIRRFLRQIAGAMKALNAKGIVHRDLKPQNILLCHSGKPNPTPSDITLKIADFGFARSLEGGVMAATLCGSPMYMAPEVIMSMKYDAKADLWSIGTIVFQCLTGKAPFQAATPQALKQFYEKTANLVPKIPSGTSKDLSDLLTRLLKRDAKDRMEFDEFFSHPFLKSSPVPVPVKRRSLSPDLPPLVQSPTYTSPSQTWGSEMGGEEPAQDVGLGTSPPIEMRISPLEKRESLSSPEDQDFVIVPSNIPEDSYADRAKGQNTNWQSGNLSSSPSRNVLGTSPQKVQRAVNINPAACGVTYRASNTSTGDSPRPGFLPVSSPQGSPTGKMHSQLVPVPVPSQREAYEQIQRSLRDSTSASASGSSESLDKMSGQSGQSGQSVEAPLPLTSPPRSPKALQTDVTMRQDSYSSQGSDHGKIMTDISSLSPPTVQFTVGTPPGGGRRRSYSGGTPPPPHTGRQTPPTFRQFTPPAAATFLAGSPLRRSSGPFFNNFPVFGNANYLPPILGSPTKEFHSRTDKPLWGCRCQTEPCLSAFKSYDAFGNYSPSPPLRGAFTTRALTLPEISTKDQWPAANKKETPEQYDSGLQRSGSFGRLAEHGVYRSHQGTCSTLACHNAHPNMLMQLGHQAAHQHYHYWMGNPRECQATGRMRHNSAGGIGMCVDSSPPGASFLPPSTSPPNMDPIVFVPPELPEETLLGKEHNETLAKLNFILTLVDCILDLAKSRSTPITSITESYNCKESQTEQISVMSDGYRRAEQLVLYMKALQLLSSSLQLSRDEVQASRLQPSSVVRNLLQDLKERFHYCMNMCKTLNTPGVLQSAGVDINNSSLTADRLIYNYAIEMCQSAALEELFGNPHESCKRYQTAQILLHSLSQQVSSDEDKKLLSKYREAVEKRLIVLHKQGYIYLYT